MPDVIKSLEPQIAQKKPSIARYDEIPISSSNISRGGVSNPNTYSL